jgi:NAD(P)-dependent dehydrogenase (short-subunit alcohol dehydrogenase family)
MREFAGKVAVVTGAASGIGFAAARVFAEQGMAVALLDVREGEVAAAAQDLAANGARAIGLCVDVRDEAAVDRAAKEITDAYGGPHILMNNAAVFMRGQAVTEIEDAAWDWLLGVNLYGPIHCIRSFLPYMQAHGEIGRIVNTASISGFSVRDRKNGAYAVSKFGLVGFSEALRHDLKDSPIGVSIVLPGAVASDFYITSAQHRGNLGGPNLFAETPADTASGMTPEEVALRMLDGVRNDRFYIATHAPARSLLEERHSEIMAAYDAAANWRAPG